MTPLRFLRRHQRGSATVEFAIASVFFFGIVMVALDFGIYAQQNLKLGNAVEQAAVIAFNARSAEPAVDTAGLTTYVNTTAGGAPTLSYRCNGSTSCDSSAPASKCIGAPASTGGWPTFTDPSGSGSNATCAGGGVPGYYLVIRATRTYQPVAVPDRYLGGKTMTQQAVVRLS